MKTILVSGGFDPLHDGHLDYFEGAKLYGRVVVALNSDEWLIRKKGFIFMPWSARARILNAMDIIYEVVKFDDSDGTVCDALRKVKPNYFANGGDRKVPHPKEDELCGELGIVQVFNVGGEKIRSSSQLVKHAHDYYQKSV